MDIEPARASSRSRDPSVFEFDRSWEFDVPSDRLWELVCDTGSFHRWWPWLQALDVVDLVEGASTRCVIRPPLPYVIEVQLAVTRVVAQRSVDVVVSGDLHGPARLEVGPGPGGSSARLAWEVEVQRPLLRAASRVARPLLVWGHDWVVASGVEQFRRRALTPAS